MNHLKCLIGIASLLGTNLFSSLVFAQDVPYIVDNRNVREEKLSTNNIDEIAATLHTLKPSANLRCSLKVNQVREVRKFTTGEQWVEMLEVTYVNDIDYGGVQMKAYFPVGSSLTRTVKNSQFSGPVEEIKMHAGDRLDHRLTVQHDGKGHMISAEMANDLRINPCQLRID